MLPCNLVYLCLLSHLLSHSRLCTVQHWLVCARGCVCTCERVIQIILPILLLLCPLTAGGDAAVHAYLSGQPVDKSQLNMLACFLVYHSMPAPRHLPPLGLEGNSTLTLFSTCSRQFLVGRHSCELPSPVQHSAVVLLCVC